MFYKTQGQNLRGKVDILSTALKNTFFFFSHNVSNYVTKRLALPQPTVNGEW